jgi:hypothetical protein
MAVLMLQLDFQDAARMGATDSVEERCQRHNFSGLFKPLGRIVVISMDRGQQQSTHTRKPPAAFFSLSFLLWTVTGCVQPAAEV